MKKDIPSSIHHYQEHHEQTPANPAPNPVNPEINPEIVRKHVLGETDSGTSNPPYSAHPTDTQPQKEDSSPIHYLKPTATETKPYDGVQDHRFENTYSSPIKKSPSPYDLFSELLKPKEEPEVNDGGSYLKLAGIKNSLEMEPAYQTDYGFKSGVNDLKSVISTIRQNRGNKYISELSGSAMALANYLSKNKSGLSRQSYDSFHRVFKRYFSEQKKIMGLKAKSDEHSYFCSSDHNILDHYSGVSADLKKAIDCALINGKLNIAEGLLNVYSSFRDKILEPLGKDSYYSYLSLSQPSGNHPLSRSTLSGDSAVEKLLAQDTDTVASGLNSSLAAYKEKPKDPFDISPATDNVYNFLHSYAWRLPGDEEKRQGALIALNIVAKDTLASGNPQRQSSKSVIQKK